MDLDLHTLPQRWLANQLVDCYMVLCHPQYPFLHEATFRRQYDHIWTSSERPKPFVAGTVNAVLSLGCHFSPGTSTTLADSYFRRAKMLILSEPEPAEDDSVPSILQALALLAMYPQGPEAQEEVWDIIGMMIRLLPRVRPPTSNPRGPEDKITQEMNVRLRWACFVLDTVQSSYWGREPCFPHGSNQVRLPRALEDEECHTGEQSSPDSPKPPPKIFFFTETIRLCQLMRDIALSCRSSPSAAQTLEIDQQILDWYSSIPFLPSIKQGEDLPRARLWRQCEVLTARFLHLRVFLLTRHLKSNYPPAPTITAFSSVKEVADTAIQPMLEETCVKAAIALINHLAGFYSLEDGPHSAWWYDLKKIMASSGALLLFLNKMLDGPFVAASQFETEEAALHTALKLLRQIENSGKSQATETLRRLEKEVNAVKERLHNLKFGHVVTEEPQGSMADFEISADPDFIIGEDIVDQQGPLGWDAWGFGCETMDPFWLDLLH